jgi:two-component system sensor histidine kinase KdpD
MRPITFFRQSLVWQYILSLLLVALTMLLSYFFVAFMGYKVVALLLLLVVSLLAMVFELKPVLLASGVSALAWNFFFIPPLYKFTIDNPEDALLFIMYFVIATIKGVLSVKLRHAELRAKEEENQKKMLLLYDALFNSLSHELKTPISSVVTATDALRDGLGQLSQSQILTLIKEIDMAGNRLNQQVGNLLNMSRLESGQVQPHWDWCDMEEVTRTCVQPFRHSYPTYDIQLEIMPNLPIYWTDRVFVEQILHNLLRNAMEYTPENTRVIISLRPAKVGFQLEVSDDGRGIPEEIAPDIFDKFFRSAQASTGGTGLGLAIVKGFTEAMDGSVKFSNRPEGGACFKVYIPAMHTEVQNLTDEIDENSDH